MTRFSGLIACVVICLSQPAAAGIVDVVASGNGANVETISQVVFDLTIGGSTNLVTQNAPKNSNDSATSAVLQSITTSAGVLSDFTFTTPTIVNDTFPNSNNGIEVLTPTGAVNVGDAGFLGALADAHSTGDLLNYLRVDGTGLEPEWDVVYGETFDSSNYLVVEERNGNTTFTVAPLDIDGNLIAGADTLSFDGSSYQWDVGYSNENDPFDDQTQVLSVLSFDLFNTTTPIGGFRVVDTGQADFKFFIGSTSISSTPEPSSLLLLALSGIWSALARPRREPLAVA